MTTITPSHPPMNVGHKELFEMVERFRKRKEYAALKKQCQQAVTEWRSATGMMLPDIPETQGKAAKWCKKPAKFGSLHGLNAAGRIVCMRRDDPSKPDAEVHEQLLLYEDNGFWCLYFGDSAERELFRVKWFEESGGRLLRSLEIGPYGVREYVLNWDGDRLVSYLDRSWSKPDIDKLTAAVAPKLSAKDASQTLYQYQYSGDGELDRLTETYLRDGQAGTPEVKYQRLPKGSNLKSLLVEAEELLVRLIPKAIRAHKVKDRVYALLLQFTGVDTDLTGYSPPLFLPTEKLRHRIAAASNHPYEELWFVGNWESDPDAVNINWEDAALDEKLHLIFQLTVSAPTDANYAPVRKMYQRVCSRLNALDWARILKTTDDFVAVPFDTHGEFDMRVDIRACVPAEKIQLLIDRGFLRKMKLK